MEKQKILIVDDDRLTLSTAQNLLGLRPEYHSTTYKAGCSRTLDTAT